MTEPKVNDVFNDSPSKLTHANGPTGSALPTNNSVTKSADSVAAIPLAIGSTELVGNLH